MTSTGNAIDDIDDEFWDDQVWNTQEFNKSNAKSKGGKKAAKKKKVCSKCEQLASKGATVTFADGSQHWQCKACVLGLSKRCFKCRLVKSKGATVTFGDGAQHWHCKPCAQRLSARKPRSPPAIVVSAVGGAPRRREPAYSGVHMLRSKSHSPRDLTHAVPPAVPARSLRVENAVSEPVAASEYSRNVFGRARSSSSAAAHESVYQAVPALNVNNNNAPLGGAGASDADGFAQCLIASGEIERGEQIGEGEHGLVFRGWLHGLEIAIKELRGASSADKAAFRAEALKMRNLPEHRNICRFLGVCMTPFAIVTRFYELGALEGVVYKHSPLVPLEPAFVRRAMLGVARGLRHLHSHAIIHRDVAARNVLLARDAASGAVDVVLTDFGMSRQTAVGGAAYTQTRFGPIKWMSSEQIDRQRYSPASDIYAFGVLCCEIAERAPPMLGLDAVESAHAILSGVRCALHSSVSAQLRQLLKWCWELDVAGRPATTDLIAALKTMPDAAFAVRAAPPDKTERKAIGEANKRAHQARFDSPKVARPSVGARLGSFLRPSSAEASESKTIRRLSSELRETRQPAVKSVANALFGVPLEMVLANDGAAANGAPRFVAQCVAMLREPPLVGTHDLTHVATLMRAHVQGIFRLSGSAAQISRIRACADESAQAARDALSLVSDPHTVAGVLKLWLRELAEPILSAQLAEPLLRAMQRSDRDERLRALHATIAALPAPRKAVLRLLLALCSDIAQAAVSITKMNAVNLAVVFAPSLTECTLMQTKEAIELLKELISEYHTLFGVSAATETKDSSYAYIPGKTTQSLQYVSLRMEDLKEKEYVQLPPESIELN